MNIIKTGPAAMVVFHYPEEEGTYCENAVVTVYESGVVNITTKLEDITTHLTNCEIFWTYELGDDGTTDNVRRLVSL